VTCTEGLNYPPVFLGVLRALKEHEGMPPSDRGLFQSLSKIEKETRTKVKLARTTSRNIIRNSGQYWKALDLIRDKRAEIVLTNFGRKVADGQISPTEFAATVVKTLELPNARIETDLSNWQRANLRIKPLEMVLSILAELKLKNGEADAFITPYELIKIIIPLAGVKIPVSDIADAIMLSRKGKLNLGGWPDCAPKSNDKRIAREFLLFLWYHGFCELIKGRDNLSDKFILSSLEPKEIKELTAIKIKRGASTAQILHKIRKSRISAKAERRRVLREMLTRPNQQQFREDILVAFQSSCIVTGTQIPSVLEAAHIIPVNNKGSDETDNGLCLRADIHLLFDSGHLRIDSDGNIHLSKTASQDKSYSQLPKKIRIPRHVSVGNLRWRWEYC